MKWISSFGGPFICTDKATAEKWLGTEGLSTRNRETIGSDYELACETEDYAGLLGGSVANVLILGDLPDEMTWVALDQGEGIFIKWVGADSEEQIRVAIDRIMVQEFLDLGFKFIADGKPLVVFDSACKLSNAGSNHIEFDLPTGIYSVSACDYKPDDSLSLIVIRLRPCPG